MAGKADSCASQPAYCTLSTEPSTPRRARHVSVLASRSLHFTSLHFTVVLSLSLLLHFYLSQITLQQLITVILVITRRLVDKADASGQQVMPLFTVQNNINLALISITIAPSTAIALSVLSLTYLYIIYTRAHPLESRTPLSLEYGNDRGARRPLRRPPLLKRLAARLRERKRQRDGPQPLLWLPFAPQWLPLRLGIRARAQRGREVQSAGVAPSGRRRTQQRLLE